MEDSDQQQQEDEMVALDSIFGSEMVSKPAKDSLCVGIPSLLATPRLELHLSMPTAYPSRLPPVFRITSVPSILIDISVLNALGRSLEEMFLPGEVILFSWIAHLQSEWDLSLAPPAAPPSSRLQDDHEGATDTIEALETKTETDDSKITMHSTELATIPIISGEPITEKKSKFQAHLAHVTDVHQVQEVISTLLTNKKIAQATHNISAYRIERTPGYYLQDCDDDGETAAGGRLLHLLQMVDAKNVVVVVSRWFGGTLLGPARFGLINSAARKLLDDQQFIAPKKNAR